MMTSRCIACDHLIDQGDVCLSCRDEMWFLKDYIHALDDVEQANELEELVRLPIWECTL